nr:type III secretion system outer membrane ring subunit SctC [Mycetohabitans sp. B3]
MTTMNWMQSTRGVVSAGAGTMRKKLVCAACIASLALAATPVFADDIPIRWHSRMVHVSVEGKDIKDVLRDLASSQGVPATISGDVHGKVTGRFDMPPQRFLETLASTFGFVWFYDGTVLSISDSSGVTRQVVQLQHATIDDLKAALDRLRITNPAFPLSYDDTRNTVLVNGPPQYVQLIAEVARRVDAAVARQAGSQVRVFSLKHAWAADHNVDVDGQRYVVAGVASVLSALYHPESKAALGGSENGSQSGFAKAYMRRVDPMADAVGNLGGTAAGGGPNGSTVLMPPLPDNMPAGTVSPGLAGLLGGIGSGGRTMGGSMAGLPGQGAGDYGGGAARYTAGFSGDLGPAADTASLPVIQADERTNSVLIRDLPERLAQYQSLIDALDVKPRLVEIEAHIIEVDDDALKQIGVDWRAHNSHIDLQTGNGLHSPSSYDGTLNPTFTSKSSDGTTVISTAPLGASLTAVLGNAGRYLLARVDALQSANLARIDASPKVATLSNAEAVMDHKTRFFVRVAGYTSADLYSVSTGVSLRVRPLVVEEDGRTQIKLEVHIEDGQVTNQLVDNIPVVTTSTINTEAFVGQNESLLIAGYRTDSSSNLETGIPLLSKIPLIGGLFRYRSDQRSHMERIFLLSPRIIEF